MIGVPLDFGASRRGVEMGPAALRIAQMAESLRALGHTVTDIGDVTVPQRATISAEIAGRGFLPLITQVCEELAEETADAVAHGEVPLVLGGDHSLVAGSLAGAARHFAARGESVGCVYLDTHGDLHMPNTSLTGNVHGMPLAHLLGHGDERFASIAGASPALSTKQLALVGIRDLDVPEKEAIRAWGITCFTMRDIDEMGLREVMRRAIAVATSGTDHLWVSCDMDWVDPADAPGVGTPVRGGATYREAQLAMEMVSDSGKLVGLDIVETNPVLDERNRTAELAVQLAMSAFGHRII
ncbi:MAG: arginase [Gemmatimonadaceae bacterium]|nr:arginase [Gemmatimonadaceae bacterium]NUO94751.1 arginase [Gemmatimonadaceae bacterium]NUP57007.1 arginase [Gemmatimonadaceae bacterium]NUP69817.1 arginase [Gemmatimonadaceae bacterium]NUR34630.1 arginase [Gemmatimonadaceae bacterium]